MTAHRKIKRPAVVGQTCPRLRKRAAMERSTEARRLRARIEDLRDALDLNRGLLRELSLKAERLENELRRAHKRAGEFSALFNPRTVAVPSLPGTMPKVRVDATPHLPPLAFGDKPLPINIVISELDVLTSEVTRRGGGPLHTMVRFGNGQLGYAVSDEMRVAWRRGFEGGRELAERIAVDMIAPELAQLLGRSS